MLESHTAAYIIQVQSQHIQKSAIFTCMDIVSPKTATRYRACYFASYEFVALETSLIKLLKISDMCQMMLSLI